MNIGISTFVWTSPFGDDALWLADRVRELGFDVLEICVEDPATLSADALVQAAERAGLEISVCGVFGPDRDLASDDVQVRRDAHRYLEHCIELAAAVGSSHVVGPMYSGVGVTGDRERRLERAASALPTLADAAEAVGVRLALEPLNRFETDLVTTVADGVALCERIGRENVGLLLDTFHMNIEERSFAAAIELAGDRIFHVHTCENDRGAPGSGHVPWGEVLGALDSVGYDGQLVIESFNLNLTAIARAVSLWRPVAESPDALARDGLAFLRGLRARADETRTS